MTAVPRLQLLPAPGATPGATAVAAPGQDDRRVQPVLPAKAVQRGRPEFQQTTIDERRARERLANGHAANDRRAGDERVGQGSGRAHGAPARNEAAGGRQFHFSRLAALPFMVQVLGQQSAGGRPQAAAPETSLSGHRDAAALSSDIYRKAGGEPEFLPDRATFVRLAV